MKNQLVYVELKSRYKGNGPAWIGFASGSKTGATIYFAGKAFKSLKGSGISANYYDIETGDEYWISGIKKNNQDRHWAGSGKIMIDENAIEAWCNETKTAKLPNNLFIGKLDPSEQQPSHHDLENKPRLKSPHITKENS